MKKSYRAEPSDVWSCGIVLVAMLSGGEPSVYFHFVPFFQSGILNY